VAANLHDRPLLLLGGTAAAAWLAMVAADLAGWQPLLHHHSLIEGGLPLWAALGLFLPAWLVMVAGMMLPSSLPMLAAHGRLVRREQRPGTARAAFVAAYLATWMAFGGLALIGDATVHYAVDTNPAVALNRHLIGPATLVGAGIFQFTPLKRRCLARCRSALGFLVGRYRPGAAGALRLGLAHSLGCLGCCWALMLVMFAAGVAALTWMLALTAVIVAEKVLPGGDRLSAPVGATLVLGGVLLAFGWRFL
jgi:predicted metal-binding membrane protein